MHSVKRIIVRTHALSAASALCLLTNSGLWAQTKPATADSTTDKDRPVLTAQTGENGTASASAPDQNVYILDRFSVTAETEGYKAVDTLGGARIRTNLSDTPSSLSVVTQKFLQDTGITNAQDLLVYTTNTEAAGLNGNFSGVSSRGSGVSGNPESARLLNPAGTNRARGVSGMDNTRNYFTSEIPWDSFNISRVDISRGPNSFLFGVGSPSGIANYSTNEALFKTQGTLEGHVGSFGTTRGVLDYNKVIIPKELAARIDFVDDNTQYQQKPAFNHTKRAYASVRYEPQALATDKHRLKITANAEKGRVRSNNPRELPPMDFITGYFSSGVNKGGYDPFIYNTSSGLTGGFFASLSPWVSNADYHYAWPSNTPTYWFDSVTGTLSEAYQSLNSVTGANGSTVGGLPQAAPLYTTGYANYAIAANYANSSICPGAHAGTVTYNNKSLTDTSIFDFYNKLIDGHNKREWQDWNSFNVAIEQSLFNDRFAIQAIVDRQDYTAGQEGAMNGYTAPYISVDLDAYKIMYPSYYSSAVANTNVGRPFIAGDFTSGNHSSHYVHNNYQVTASGTLRADDFMQKSDLSRILGYHNFTALGGIYTTKQEDRAWTLYRVSDEYGMTVNGDASYTGIQWVEYLGNSLKSTSSASGINLNAASTLINPTSGVTKYFSNTYTSSTAYTSSWTNPYTGSTSTYSDNPEAYQGWTNIATRVLNSRDNIDELYTSGTKAETRLKTASFMYQGFFWDETIIPTFGWRRDTVRQRSASAPINSDTNVASMHYDITAAGAVVNTTSTSYGITLHLPKKLRGNLPFGTDVSLHYFHGSNETPKVRYSFAGTQLPSEKGKTDDFGVQVDTLHGRASFRLTVFKTIDTNASASSGAADPLGSNGYYMYLLPAWGAADAAANAMYLSSGYDMWGFNEDGTSGALTATRTAAVNAWKNNMAKYFPQSFFDAYGLGVNVSAMTSGNYANIYNDTSSYPFPWTIVNSNGGKINGTYPIVNQDIESKGFELEATFRPMPNWDITFNASKVNAVQTRLGKETSDFVKAEYEFFNSAAGNLPLWGYWGGSSGQTLKAYFNQYIWSAYLLQTAQAGTPQPELSKWNFKGITNYTFTRGTLKGVNIGGGYRWASKPILGYGIKQINETDSDGNKMWIMDVNQPRYGKIEQHVDAWIGYERQLTRQIKWRIQLNIKNLGENPHLVPVSVEPDGSWAQQRITQGQTWDVSTKLIF